MSQAKKIIIIAAAAVFVGGCSVFVLLLAVLLSVGDAADEAKRGTIVLAVRHRLHDDRSLLLGRQCLEHTIRIADYSWQISDDGLKATGDGHTLTILPDGRSTTTSGYHNFTRPQPFGKIPAVSDFIEHEYKFDEEKTQHYLVEVSGDDCWNGAPHGSIGFRTGQFTARPGERLRIEVNFLEP